MPNMIPIQLPGGETVPLSEVAAVWRLLQVQQEFLLSVEGGGQFDFIADIMDINEVGVGPTPWAALLALAAKVDGTAAGEKGEGT